MLEARGSLQLLDALLLRHGLSVVALTTVVTPAFASAGGQAAASAYAAAAAPMPVGGMQCKWGECLHSLWGTLRYTRACPPLANVECLSVITNHNIGRALLLALLHGTWFNLGWYPPRAHTHTHTHKHTVLVFVFPL